jgi:hypothetical protein
MENVQVFENHGRYVEATNSNLTEVYSKALTKYSVWRRATDGFIDCIWWHDDEELWVRNFKRGILDAFQNDLVKTDYWQTGVIGTCHVKQSIVRKRSPWEMFIHKEYDMSSCYDQPKQITSSIKLVPEINLVGSQFYDVKRTSWRHAHSVKDVGVVWKEVSNVAVYTFMPFGRQGGGPYTAIEQHLKYVSNSIVDEPKPPTGTCECSSIVFEFPEPDVHIPDSKCDLAVQKQAEEKIDLLAKNFAQPEKIGYAREFLDTVTLLRKACPRQMRNLWTLYNETAEYRVVHREIFLDALPVVCTDASVQLLSKDVLGEGLSVRRSHTLLKDMHFCNQTTKTMVHHYKNYVDSMVETSCMNCSNYDMEDLKVERWLLLGTLIHQLDCQGPVVKESLVFLEDKLETVLREWRKTPFDCLEKDIIAVIDALGNAGCVDSLEILSAVWSDKALPSSVRIAAIQANKLMIEVAAMQIFNLVKPVFLDTTNPSEVRITAWDMLMEEIALADHPVPFEDYSPIVFSLRYESDVNVGSYAMSWLHAWADNPNSNSMRTLATRNFLMQTGAMYWGSQFNLAYPASKFRFISWSPFSSEDLILSVTTRELYDTDRILPQSASIEVDMRLLGQTIPVFKVEGHMKGASWMLENLFGPVGYFSTRKTYDVQSGLKHVINTLMKPFPGEDWNITIRVSMLGREFRHWARSRCWFDEYMRNSPFYNVANSLFWLFHDTGYDMSENCPWTIESPVWHNSTGFTWKNIVECFQGLRERLTFVKLFYDGTVWERVLNMDATSVLLEEKVAFPSMAGIPLFIAGNITAHVNMDTSGNVTLPEPAGSTWWPQALWSHLKKIWNIWANPQTVEWHAEINPRINLESSFALGIDAHIISLSLQVEMDVKSNHKIQLEGTLEPDNYSVSYKIPRSDSGVSSLASYQSKVIHKHCYPDSIVEIPVENITILPFSLEKGIICTPKELIGVELCAQYQYYNSENSWGPYYPLNGPSSGKILLSTANRPCNGSCGYITNTCCAYDKPPTKITGRILKIANDSFRFTLEGTGSVPERTVLMDYSRDRDYPTDVMSANISWNTCQNYELNHVTSARLAFSWDRIFLQCVIIGKAPSWEMTSSSWMNRTFITSNTEIYYYESDTPDMCKWKKPLNPYRLRFTETVTKRKEGLFRMEFEDLCHVTHWWQVSYTINQLMMNINMDSSLFMTQDWKFGLPLPRPFDTASCYVFGSNFITFDRLHYAVDAPGSYYLVQDISSNNFTVILHHSDSSRVRELEVWIAGTQFLLTAEGLIVNGANKAIPYKSCIANVTMWNTSCDLPYIRMTSQAGLEIYYNTKAIELSVNGFYFGHLRGLCGNNNNNERRGDEWIKSDNEVARTATEFVDSWAVNGLPAKELVSYDFTKIKICSQTFFNMDSMEPIGHEVDLNAFYKACLVEVQKSHTLKEFPEMGVCRAIDGVKVASFSRDFTLPKICWYGPWSDWTTSPENIEVRQRKLIYGCDVCCERIETESRLINNSKLYVCEPSILQQQFVKIGPSKECLSLEELPTCSSGCISTFGTPQSTAYNCGNSVDAIQQRLVEKCFCTNPC